MARALEADNYRTPFRVEWEIVDKQEEDGSVLGKTGKFETATMCMCTHTHRC